MPIPSTKLAELKASAEQGNSASAGDTLLLLAEIDRMAARERGAGGTGTATTNGAGGRGISTRLGPLGDPLRPVETYGILPDGTAYVTGGYGARGTDASTS